MPPREPNPKLAAFGCLGALIGMGMLLLGACASSFSGVLVYANLLNGSDDTSGAKHVAATGGNDVLIGFLLLVVGLFVYFTFRTPKDSK